MQPNFSNDISTKGLYISVIYTGFVLVFFAYQRKTYFPLFVLSQQPHYKTV